MIFENEVADSIGRGAILAVLALLWVVLLVRMVGLRSFSKMSSFDFVMTVAMGSLMGSASQSSNWLAFVQSLSAMVGLFAIQVGAAVVRRRSPAMKSVLANQPLLLMRDGVFIDSALAESRVERGELIAKLREANVLDLAQVRAAVLETTGDVSVLHGEHLKEKMLAGVRGA